MSFSTFWHAKGGLQMCVFLGRAMKFFWPQSRGRSPPPPVDPPLPHRLTDPQIDGQRSPNGDWEGCVLIKLVKPRGNVYWCKICFCFSLLLRRSKEQQKLFKLNRFLHTRHSCYNRQHVHKIITSSQHNDQTLSNKSSTFTSEAS